MGDPPDWYPVMRAARYLGVAVWELATPEHAQWVDAAIAAESAEATAKQHHSK